LRILWQSVESPGGPILLLNVNSHDWKNN